jgi:hypothetical protein
VREGGGGLDLAEKAVGTKGVREFGVQHLEGDGTPVPEVLGEIDRRHGAVTKLAFDAIAVGECVPEAFQQIDQTTAPAVGIPIAIVGHAGSPGHPVADQRTRFISFAGALFV